MAACPGRLYPIRPWVQTQQSGWSNWSCPLCFFWGSWGNQSENKIHKYKICSLAVFRATNDKTVNFRQVWILFGSLKLLS